MLLSPCPRVGLSCRKDMCAGPDEACGGLAKCEGTDKIAFCVGGYRLRMKCSALGAGFSCKPSAVTGARCQQATQCNPDTAKGTETCTGTKLNLCSGGKTVQVDCKALGFSGCSAGSCG